MIAPNFTPLAWAYARVSDERQYERNNSIPEQTERMTRYYQLYLGPEGVDWAGVETDDRAVSASKINFAHRPAGKRLLSVLRSGDHLIVDKPDRLWREARDFENVLYWFKQQHVTLHFVDFIGGPLNTGNGVGELMLRITIAIAQREAELNSERQRASNNAKRKAGRMVGKYPPMGCRKRVVRVNGRKVNMLEWDIAKRSIMAEIVKRRQAGQSWGTISDEIEQHLAQASGRVFIKSAFYRRLWDIDQCRRAYWVEMYIRDHGIRDVTELPSNLSDVAHAYCRDHDYLRVHR